MSRPILLIDCSVDGAYTALLAIYRQVNASDLRM
jgi:hypothetical protein